MPLIHTVRRVGYVLRTPEESVATAVPFLAEVVAAGALLVIVSVLVLAALGDSGGYLGVISAPQPNAKRQRIGVSHQ